MLQSDSDTRLVPSAPTTSSWPPLLMPAAPLEGNLAGSNRRANEDEIGLNEDYNRIAMLAGGLTATNCSSWMSTPSCAGWEEKVLRFEPQTPRFACTCSRERVANMIRGLEEAESILHHGEIEVGCGLDAVERGKSYGARTSHRPVRSSNRTPEEKRQPRRAAPVLALRIAASCQTPGGRGRVRCRFAQRRLAVAPPRSRCSPLP